MTSSRRFLIFFSLAAMLAAPVRAQDAVPSQDLFADWPTQAAKERPYWLPWAYPSFQRASLFGRPILFVLGVEWSHTGQRVMQEILTDPELTAAINERYIVVVADGDRRPDLKERFRQVGWPSLHLLLPDGSPMISGVTGEADQRAPITSGPLGLKQATFLVEEGANYWELRPSELRQIADDWIAAQPRVEPEPIEISLQTSDAFARLLSGDANRRDGGFGIAPHYLRPALLEYATVASERDQNRLLEHARFSVERIVSSPLFDVAEGGLHRMAATADWGGLEYEKLLHQQSSLMRELTIALRGEAAPGVRESLRATARFVIDQLGREEGGFYNAMPASDGRVAPNEYWATPDRDPGRRPRPQGLVLAGPTASTGAALVRAGVALDDDAIVEAGKAALDYVVAQGWNPGRGFRHVLVPRPTDRLFLTTQAEVSFALFDAYQATGESRYLDAAREGALYAGLNLREGREALLRDHLRHPQAVGAMQLPRWPLGANVRYARTLIRLAHLDGEPVPVEARAILARLAGQLESVGAFGVELALAIEELERAPRRIRLLGSAGSKRDALLREALDAAPLWTVIEHGPLEGKAEIEIVDGEERRSISRPDALRQALELEP